MTITNTLQDNRIQRFPFPASVAFSLNDFVVWNPTLNQVQSITSLVTGASEAVDQATVAASFLGCSNDVRLATETDNNAIRTVCLDGIFDVSCVSFTPQPGSLVGVTWNGGSALVQGYVKQVTTLDHAIGVVVDIPTQTGNSSPWGTATTTVRIRLLSRLAQSLIATGLTGVPGANGTSGTADAGSGLQITMGAGGTATTGTGGAGGAIVLTAGAGGTTTGAAGTGGAGGAVTLKAGAGAATSGSGASPGGAGGTFTIAGGAGGNAGAGTGNGGAGGNVVVNGGAGGTTTGGSAGAAGIVQLANNVAPAAAGSAAAFVQLSSTANFGIYFGSGAPTVSAAQGSIYLRTDGSSTSTRLYVNTTGSTTWTNVTTAA